MALSGLINALYETNCVAITRRVYAARSAPRIGCLVPQIKARYEVHVWVEGGMWHVCVCVCVCLCEWLWDMHVFVCAYICVWHVCVCCGMVCVCVCVCVCVLVFLSCLLGVQSAFVYITMCGMLHLVYTEVKTRYQYARLLLWNTFHTVLIFTRQMSDNFYFKKFVNL